MNHSSPTSKNSVSVSTLSKLLQRGQTFGFLAALFVVVVLALSWNAVQRRTEADQQHQQLIESSARGTVSHLETKISEMRRAVKLFGERELPTLRHLVAKSDDYSAYDALVARARAVFEGSFTVSLAGTDGKPYVEDFSGFVSELCLKDIRHYAKTRSPANVFVHPNNAGYHFDIMARIELEPGRFVIFVVALKPAIFSELLAHSQLFEHRIVLLKSDVPGLVEISSDGTRDVLREEQFRLTAAQQENIRYRMPVPGTAWDLVYLDEHGKLSGSAGAILRDIAVELALLLPIFVFVYYWLSRAERATRAAHQQADEANNAKSAFLANMSHEMRTPMTAIIGFSNTLLEAGQAEVERAEAAHSIVRNSKHLLQLINDILDISKIEANRLEVEAIATPLFPLLADIESIAGELAQRRGIQFIVDPVFPLPQSIVSDPLRLKQILINLCSNAVKFTHEGSVTLRVRCDISQQTLFIDVIDTGIGLTREQQGRLFQSFVQADASTTRKYGGTGLGLSLSRQLAEKLGGTLAVSSESGIGSRFTLTLSTGPLDHSSMVAAANTIPATPVQSARTALPRLSGTVLVAEDTPDVQSLLQHYLSRIGVMSTFVDDGAKAIQHARANTYDLILMDMQMPVMGGMQATRELRVSGYAGRIIALTANATAADRERCIQAGCDDFVAKPIDVGPFCAMLERYLKVEAAPAIQPLISTVLAAEPDLEELVLRFVDGLPERAARLKTALDVKEWDSALKQLHQFMGVAGGLGYLPLTTLAREFEQKIASATYSEVPALVTALDALIARIVAGVRNE